MGTTSKHSLQNLSKSIRNERVWCEFMLLHLNIKACVSWVKDTGKWITLFVGKKSYQAADDSKPLILEYRAKDTQNLLSVEMYAKKGPYGTSDYRIQLYVIPVEDGVYWELRISQHFGFIAKHLTKLYLSTVAKEKIGFTIVGRNKSGQIEYVGGQQGVAERNIVRYLLSRKVYLEPQVLPSDNLFQKRAELWFKEPDRYRRQLHELKRKEYLQNKKREYQNQLLLQNKYDALRGF